MQPGDVKDMLDRLSFENSRISAVTIEMYGCLGWFGVDKDVVLACSKKSITGLLDIQRELEGMNVPDQLTSIKEVELEMIAGLIEIYEGIEDKGGSQLAPMFMAIRKYQETLSDDFEAAYKQYGWLQEIDEDYDPVNEELDLLADENDKKDYLNAVDLMRAGEYGKAYHSLIGLAEDHKSKPFEKCAKMKLAECLITDPEAFKGGVVGDPARAGLTMLEEIIEAEEYSPVLFEAFYRWRTVQQFYEHGVSNASKIPNDYYNNKRWDLICLIRSHLIDKPDDAWAKAQAEYILQLHNITRGGPVGNSSLSDWALLFPTAGPDLNSLE